MLVRKETAKAAKGGRRGKRLISAVGKCMATTYARGTARASGGFETVHAGMFPESNRAGLITALHIITCFAFTAGGQSRPPRRLHMQLRLRERNLQEKRRADINILFECGVKTNLDRIR